MLTPTSLSSLQDVLRAYPEPCILLVRGQTAFNDSVTFGAFLSVPGLDTSDIAKSPEFKDSFLFQLSPVHDVFPALAGEPVWALSGQDLWFGDEAAGVAFCFTEGLRRGILMHRTTANGAYEGNGRRGE